MGKSQSKEKLAIGVDVGGSHVSFAAFALINNEYYIYRSN